MAIHVKQGTAIFCGYTAIVISIGYAIQALLTVLYGWKGADALIAPMIAAIILICITEGLVVYAVNNDEKESAFILSGLTLIGIALLLFVGGLLVEATDTAFQKQIAIASLFGVAVSVCLLSALSRLRLLEMIDSYPRTWVARVGYLTTLLLLAWTIEKGLLFSTLGVALAHIACYAYLSFEQEEASSVSAS